MPEYVRARDNDTGHHVTIPRSLLRLRSSAFTELKSPALHPDGSPVQPKYKTTVSNEADRKSTTNAGQSAEPKKEN